jgi:hypothetical protein
VNTLLVRTGVERDSENGDRFVGTKILVDGRPLVDFDARALAVDLRQLQRSIQEDGEFFVVTCACGDAACAGIRQGIAMRRDSKNVHWVVRGLGPTQTLSFDRQLYADAVARGITQLCMVVRQTGLDVVPGQNRLLVDGS